MTMRSALIAAALLPSTLSAKGSPPARPVIIGPSPGGQFPAPPEEGLCHATSVVLGAVMHAVSHDCRPKGSSCEPTSVIGLKIRVDGIVGAGDGRIHERDIISADTNFLDPKNDLMYLQRLNPHKNLYQIILLSQSRKPLTNDQAQRDFAGKKFFFALSASAKVNEFWVITYNLDKGDWIRKTLLDGGCAIYRHSK